MLLSITQSSGLIRGGFFFKGREGGNVTGAKRLLRRPVKWQQNHQTIM